MLEYKERRLRELAAEGLVQRIRDLQPEIENILRRQEVMIRELTTIQAELQDGEVVEKVSTINHTAPVAPPVDEQPAPAKPRKHRKFSKAARKRMSEAQKARYAKQRGEIAEAPPKKRTRKRS